MARRSAPGDAAPPWFVPGARPPRITDEEIVATAHAIVHAGGVEALSLRALARELGIATSGLHRRIERKEQLMIAVADLVLSEVSVGDGAVRPDRWRRVLHDFSVEVRRVLEDHPHVHPVLDSHVLLTPSTVRIAERALSILRAAGFRRHRLVDAYNAWAGYVFGFSVLEMQPAVDAAERDRTRRWVRSYLRSLDPSRFPTVCEEIELLENRALGLRWGSGPLGPTGTSFTAGLEAMLAGLDAARGRVR
jgi:AcrR family transcriptional regulator